MAEIIPIATNPAPVRSLPIPQTGAVRRSVGHWTDTRGRPLRDLRISVTDHCNFRCRYCMPKEKFSNPHAFLAHTELLTFEEILRIARIVVANGVEKLRLTGGEPLLRKGLEELVAELRRLRTPRRTPPSFTRRRRPCATRASTASRSASTRSTKASSRASTTWAFPPPKCSTTSGLRLTWAFASRSTPSSSAA